MQLVDRNMIIIIDYGMGNLGSIANMLHKIGMPGVVSGDPEIIAKADKLVLPGVGAFDAGMSNLESRGLVSILNKQVLECHVPILGICLGMQLFSKISEEGILPGLGWVNAETVRFRFDADHKNLKIPHMGWNTVNICKDSILFDNIKMPSRFYFVHSYHVVCEDQADILTKTVHGYDFVSSLVHANITSVQFHPEKSHKFGMGFLKNWALS